MKYTAIKTLPSGMKVQALVGNVSSTHSAHSSEDLEVYVPHHILHSHTFKYQLPNTMKNWTDIEVLIRGFDPAGFGRKVKTLSRTLFEAGFLKFTATFGSDIDGGVIELATYTFSIVSFNDTEVELKLDRTGFARGDTGVYQERPDHYNYAIEGIVFRGLKK